MKVREVVGELIKYSLGYEYTTLFALLISQLSSRNRLKKQSVGNGDQAVYTIKNLLWLTSVTIAYMCSVTVHMNSYMKVAHPQL